MATNNNQYVNTDVGEYVVDGYWSAGFGFSTLQAYLDLITSQFNW